MSMEERLFRAIGEVDEALLERSERPVGAKQWGSWAVLGGLAVLFGRQLLSIYTSDLEVIPFGLDRIHVICLTYLLCGLMDVTCGVVGGMGAAVTPTIVSLTGACVLRVIWIYTVFASFHNLTVLYLSYPVTWAVTFTVHLICFSFFYHRLCRMPAAPAWE